MPGTLFLVATPIGNLEDVTLRALRVLREVDLVAAEDTRRTGGLLRHFQIDTPTISFHEHNELERTGVLLERLRRGQSVAVVSDAGTPSVSDPGFRLVRAAITENIPVQAIPGASAVLAALVASGLPTDSFTFAGFPPYRSQARKQWFAKLAELPHTVVFFEAPHRIQASLSDALKILGDRSVAVGRELTKIHEELVRGPISVVVSALKNLRGEFTVVVAPADAAAEPAQAPVSDEGLRLEFCQMTENSGLSRRDSISRLARRYGRPAREIYAALERSKG